MSSAHTQQEQFPDLPFISTSTAKHLLASTQLLVGLEPSNRMMATATGEAGIGKTTALHACQQALEQQTPPLRSVAFVGAPHTTARQVIAQLLTIVQEVTHMGTTHTLFENVVSILKERESRLIVIDDADMLTEDSLKVLSSLYERTRCSILLVGLPVLVQRLGQREMRHLDLQLKLPPLSFEEVLYDALPALPFPGWVFHPEHEADRLLAEE